MVEPTIIEALGTASGQAALAAAAHCEDPSGLPAAATLRARFPAALAAAALSQESLRRKARIKFGDAAAAMLFTPDGLQQASRPEVAAWRARRIVAAGAEHVVDLGCGIGADSLAFAAAGLRVTAVELDPATAVVARANLGERARVLTGDAEQLAAALLSEPDIAVFCDPARRTTSGRVWQVDQFTPGWSLVQVLLTSGHVTCIKLGPALPQTLIPTGVEAEWVSHAGDVVEVSLWSGPGSRSGARAAALLPAEVRLVRTGAAPAVKVTGPRTYLYEPDGAVIRAGAVTNVAAELDAALLDPHLAYLTGDRRVSTPLATTFRILDVLPYQEKALRGWVREHQVGTLEIKKRGIDVDPALLRKRLKPRGPGSATLVLTRTPTGAKVLVVERQLGLAKPVKDGSPQAG